jgi:hypothetical protein
MLNIDALAVLNHRRMRRGLDTQTGLVDDRVR